jgi:hypothetical protein
MRIFTLDDITHFPENGEGGWFYGIVRDHETNKIGIYEIYPEIGYCKMFNWWHPRVLFWIIRDVFHQVATRKTNFKRMSNQEYIERKEQREQEKTETMTLEEFRKEMQE